MSNSDLDSSTTVNPLEEASHLSLDDLFNSDPLGLTLANRTAIVDELRRQRKNWAEAQASGTKPKAAKVAKPSMTLDQIKNLSLDDLGL